MDFLDSTFSANVWLTSHKHPKYNHDKSTHYQITSKASRNQASTPKKKKEKRKGKKKEKTLKPMSLISKRSIKPSSSSKKKT